jgi:hypothetical protein
MTEYQKLSGDPPAHPIPLGMDFAGLYQEGLDFIQKASGKIWTDHNSHDPGMTMLDQLCYLITDLSYRLDFDIKDILASPSGEILNQFFTARQILTSAPLNINDFRKLLIDIKGVKNAWLEPIEYPLPEIYYDPEILYEHPETKEKKQSPGLTTWYSWHCKDLKSINIKGLYRVLIQKEPDTDKTEAELKKQAEKALLANRNLCEDFPQISILPTETIFLKAEIQMQDETGNIDFEHKMAEIYLALSEFISPQINFYSWQELKSKDRTIEEIFSGPRLSQGFIDEQELEKYQKTKELHTSDLYNIILNIEDVFSVKNLSLSSDLSSETEAEWIFPVSEFHAQELKSIEKIIDDQDIKFYRSGELRNLNKAGVLAKLEELKTAKNSAKKDLDIAVAKGNYREPAYYETIQNEFPLCYGIGEFGLPDAAGDLRKAQAKQLQAYLMLFDQIFTNYFSQLNNVKTLFSTDFAADQSYFPGLLTDAPGAKQLLKDYDVKWLDSITEDDPLISERKSRLLDHMLARFCERFKDKDSLYTDTDSADSWKKWLNSKSLFLQHYHEHSYKRGSAFDYTADYKEENSISGFQKRVCALLGIPEFKTGDITGSDKEGFYVVEHILLRQKIKGNSANPFIFLTEDLANTDFYSFALSILLPEWAGRFKDKSFRKMAEKLLHTEAPAHIDLRVLWLSKEKISEFETLYKDWQEKGRTDKSSAGLIEFLGLGIVPPPMEGIGHWAVETHFVISEIETETKGIGQLKLGSDLQILSIFPQDGGIGKLKLGNDLQIPEIFPADKGIGKQKLGMDFKIPHIFPENQGIGTGALGQSFQIPHVFIQEKGIGKHKVGQDFQVYID